MIILSLNVRGVGGAHKQQVLVTLFSVYSPNIVLLQEIMCLGSKSIDILSTLLKTWNLCSIDIEGLSRGLVTGWNSNVTAISTHFIPVGIILEGEAKDWGKIFNIVNLYAPYGDRGVF